jgi:redox-sensitive bicupin YhaK (pirin superfamily)
MNKHCKIKDVYHCKSTIEGAGVKLNRVFGYHEVPAFDPFLLLDFFGSDNPDDYLAGFPWHPHRGIETVTYMIQGSVAHMDSLGNSGVISSGDVQWMTAGSGIIHQELPKIFNGRSRGLQLWINLPAENKMTDPKYRDMKSENIPEITLDNNIKIKIIAGKFNNTAGPVEHLSGNPQYFHIIMPPHTKFEYNKNNNNNLFAFVMDGTGFFEQKKETKIISQNCVKFGDGSPVTVQSEEEELDFILVEGKPLSESVAWHGPIVMNTKEELQTAFIELDNNTFIKKV